MDTSLAVQDRIQQCLPIGDASRALLPHYMSAANQDRGLADDALRIQGFILQYADANAGLAREFMASIPRSDPSYDTRVSGLNQMRLGLAQMLRAGIISLQAPRVFTPATRTVFAQHLAQAYLDVAPDLPTETREQLTETLTQIAATDENPNVREAIARALRLH